MLYNFNSEEPSTICMRLGNQTSDIKKSQNLAESACMLAGGCTPKWAQLRRKPQFTGSFWRQPELTVPTALLSEKYSCTDHVSTIAKHFPYGTSVCSSLTSENFGQNRYRKSGVCHLVCIIQYIKGVFIQRRTLPHRLEWG